MKHLWSPWRMAYIQNHPHETGCVFCREMCRAHDPESLVVFRGQRAFAILNRYPYTSGHVLIVPYEHVATLDALDASTRAELMELITQGVQVLQKEYHPQGFNIGLNLGEAAGAGITEHLHIHIVPRWIGDTNFMATLGETRVLPEALIDTYHRVKQAWESLRSNSEPSGDT